MAGSPCPVHRRQTKNRVRRAKMLIHIHACFLKHARHAAKTKSKKLRLRQGSTHPNMGALGQVVLGSHHHPPVCLPQHMVILVLRHASLSEVSQQLSSLISIFLKCFFLGESKQSLLPVPWPSRSRLFLFSFSNEKRPKPPHTAFFSLILQSMFLSLFSSSRLLSLLAPHSSHRS